MQKEDLTELIKTHCPEQFLKYCERKKIIEQILEKVAFFAKNKSADGTDKKVFAEALRAVFSYNAEEISEYKKQSRNLLAKLEYMKEKNILDSGLVTETAHKIKVLGQILEKYGKCGEKVIGIITETVFPAKENNRERNRDE